MALRNATLSSDLKELNAQLAVKISMANKIAQDQGPYIHVEKKFEAVITELEDKVSILNQEKEELQTALTQASNNNAQLSEKRRKRLQELEPQIAELQKKIEEQANIIKIKRALEFGIKFPLY